MEDWDYSFDPAKNAWLIRERGISFEQIISLIEGGKLLQVLAHPNRERYPSQLLYEVDVDGYVYIVPVVRENNGLFLKTIYPSRKATKLSVGAAQSKKPKEKRDEETTDS